MTRTLDEIMKARQLPKAKEIRRKIEEQVEKLEELKQQSDIVMAWLNFYQLQHKAYTHGELTSEESIALESQYFSLTGNKEQEVKYAIKKK